MGLVSVVAGTVIMVLAPRAYNVVPIYVAYPVGVLLAIGGAVFLATRIRCPYCGARVIWDALRQQPGELHEALHRQSCHRCGQTPRTI